MAGAKLQLRREEGQRAGQGDASWGHSTAPRPPGAPSLPRALPAVYQCPISRSPSGGAGSGRSNLLDP